VPLPPGRIAVESGEFLSWWATAQCQIIFNRLPMIEEVLRMIPGAYSNWLRLWGSRIGRLTYWSPGMTVLDREYLDLGDDVVFGAGVRLNGHVILRNQQGHLELAVAPIKIGSGAAIGGYSLLTAGTEIAAGESTHALLLSPPFARWRDGKRLRGHGSE
jgi:acetyltransferase-like isoleucine patch superfamily enzyme